MKRKHYRGRKTGYTKIGMKKFIILMVALIASYLGVVYFQHTHFPKGTSIRRVDCSWLTVQQTAEKINEQLKDEKIAICFDDSTIAYISGNEIELALANSRELEEILYVTRKNKYARTFPLYNEEFSFNDEKLKESIETIIGLRTNVQKAQDARIRQDDSGYLVIDEEIYGNEYNPEKVLEHVTRALEIGETVILVGYLEQVQPEIKASDLREQVKPVNSILASQINVQLPDESTCTLDANTMKDWVTQDENGEYNIEIDEHIPKFVNDLAQQAKEASKMLNFPATGVGNRTLSVPNNKLAIVDQEKTMELIKTKLVNKESCEITPVYQQIPTSERLDKYVEIDITRQHVWLYQNGECTLDAPCVTGMKGKHDTPTGIYVPDAKITGKVLHGYNDDGSEYHSQTDIFIPFCGGVGMHDADRWRTTYGGKIYLTNGSHGCVNMPLWAVKVVYENIDLDTLIIVYQS